MRRLYKFMILLAFSASERSLKSHTQSLSIGLIFLSALWALPAHSQYTCKTSDTIDQISALTCEINRSQTCTSFFNQFTPDFQKKFGLTCPELDEGHLLKTTTLCSGLTLVAGLSAWQALGQETKSTIAKKIPLFLQKFGPRLLPYLSIFGTAVTIYSVTDIISESLKQDKRCFENIEKKQATIDFLETTSAHLIEKTAGFIDDIQARQLRLPEDYKKQKFIEQLTCQRLNEIVLTQKRKQDEILGKLIAAGKLKTDPRKELTLTENEKNEAKFLLDNMTCLSPEKRAELLCAVGNTALGGTRLKKLLGEATRRQLAALPSDSNGLRSTVDESKDLFGRVSNGTQDSLKATRQLEANNTTAQVNTASKEVSAGSTPSQIEKSNQGQLSTNTVSPGNSQAQEQPKSGSIIEGKTKYTKQSLPLVTETKSYSRWSSVSSDRPPEDTPYFALGLTNRLDGFTRSAKTSLKHPVVNYRNWNEATESIGFEKTAKLYYMGPGVTTPEAIPKILENTVKSSPNNKSILFNLDGFDLNQYRDFAKSLGGGYGNRTNEELEYILKHEHIFDHVRWFKSGKELDFKQIRDLFFEHNPNLFK